MAPVQYWIDALAEPSKKAITTGFPAHLGATARHLCFSLGSFINRKITSAILFVSFTYIIFVCLAYFEMQGKSHRDVTRISFPWSALCIPVLK